MVRNLFEYSGKDTEFQRMTSFLHIQNDTNSLTLKNLKELYVLIFESQVVKKINNLDTFFYES
jgi:hypothetical protein